MEDIYVYGSGGHAKVIIEIIEQSSKFTIKSILDIEKIGTRLFDYKILHPSDIDFNKKSNITIAIGNNKTRKKVVRECNTLIFPQLSSKYCSISTRSKIGAGTVVMPGVTINSMTIVGEHCILNTNCSVDHDCHIGNFVHISPNATLCGNVVVQEGSHIGSGATIIPGINVGKWCTIGAGAVIIQDIPDYSVVVGNPGRIIKQINN